MGDYRQLSVWKRAHNLALGIYRFTGAFPASERYGLAAQLRRAAVSIESNIAEGSGRYADRDQVRYLRIARGSLYELECQLLLCRDVGYIEAEAWETLDTDCNEIGRMLNGMIRSLCTRYHRARPTRPLS
jgi:four helix bundle protein